MLAPGTAHAGVLNWFFAHRQNWQAIQSTGGLKILPPKTSDGRRLLPVVYDASGTCTVTCKPTTINSGLIVDKIKAKRSGENIVLELYTMPVKDAGSTEGTGQMHHVDISSIPPGNYTVFYGKPDEAGQRLGSVEIK